MKLGKKQEKWLKALESGRYKQGKDKLCDKNGRHCCLGVAARSMRKKFKLESFRYSVEGCGTGLVSFEEIGLRSSGGKMRGETSSLITLNDSRGYTFKQIAHFIRENPERVFTKSV